MTVRLLRPGRPLPEEVKTTLAPYIAEIDLQRARTHIGIPWYVYGKPCAFTFGHHIYFAPGRYDPESPNGIALIAHELKHVQQFREDGRAGMSANYLYQYAKGRMRRKGHYAAYLDIAYEEAARSLQARVAADLIS
tara:strand:+ start:12727 stop:13134 length:408 start_codon:yes stop_codon:yes gene_type:complete